MIQFARDIAFLTKALFLGLFTTTASCYTQWE